MKKVIYDGNIDKNVCEIYVNGVKEPYCTYADVDRGLALCIVVDDKERLRGDENGQFFHLKRGSIEIKSLTYPSIQDEVYKHVYNLSPLPMRDGEIFNRFLRLISEGVAVGIQKHEQSKH